MSHIAVPYCSKHFFSVPNHPKDMTNRVERDAELPLDQHECCNSTEMCAGRGGLLTSKSRQSNVLTSCRLQFKFSSASVSAPLFTHVPDWLKPLLYCQHEHGYCGEWLSSLFQSLSAELLDEIRAAFISIITLTLCKLRLTKDLIESPCTLCFSVYESGTCSCIDKHNEPWLYDRSGFSDEELETYDAADVAIVRSANTVFPGLEQGFIDEFIVSFWYADRWTFEPLTRTVTELYVNQAYCHLVALPADELLARVARKDLPSRLGRDDHLAHVLASLHAQVDTGRGAGDGLEYLWWQVFPGRRSLNSNLVEPYSPSESTSHRAEFQQYTMTYM